MIANNKIKRATARIVKKTQKNEKTRLKAFIKKCNEMKKKLKKKTDINFASQENLSTFDFSNVFINFKINVYFDFDASASTEVYFDVFNSRSIE